MTYDPRNDRDYQRIRARYGRGGKAKSSRTGSANIADQRDNQSGIDMDGLKNRAGKAGRTSVKQAQAFSARHGIPMWLIIGVALVLALWFVGSIGGLVSGLFAIIGGTIGGIFAFVMSAFGMVIGGAVGLVGFLLSNLITAAIFLLIAFIVAKTVWRVLV